ncbi:hypothetical protein [Streptomyces sp. LaBMicrA B280]|uniref:hypothetical protein n=1 Tax=Streptomyces sp. LaBMicrA B280 TaxID=3391001 RepID=UPI003BA5E9B1
MARAVKAVVTYFVVKADEIREERRRDGRDDIAPPGFAAFSGESVAQGPDSAVLDGQTGDVTGVSSGA